MSTLHHVRLHAVIDGIVQGVGFRQYTLSCAQRNHVTGWVKNRRDRKVELIAEGTRSELEDFLAAVREGPPTSLVRHVDVSWEAANGTFRDFTIE
jgi:acylphosphatase